MNKTQEPAIIVKDVVKSFRIPLDKSSGIKQHIVNFYKRKKGYREFQALKGVSFEIKKGEFFGIVGRNGSGKSTLLKILAGVYTTDSGGVAVNGSLTPFIELGVGFNPELSGRENVFLNGALLGFSRGEMESMYEEIVDFAELHDFMEERLKNYSSGMQVRLAFSIAIRAQSDILLLDEVLAVGDEAFQKKCFQYFNELKRRKQTVILVSHDMESVRRYCESAILINDGIVVKKGKPSDIAEEYTKLNLESVTRKIEGSNESRRVNRDNFPVVLHANTVQSKHEGSDTKKYFMQGETICFDLILQLSGKSPVHDAEVGISFQNEAGQTIFIDSTTRKKMHGIDLSPSNSKKKIRFEVHNIFSEGKYTVSFAILDLNKSVTYGRLDDELTFYAASKEKANWLLKPPTNITYM